MSVGSGEVVGLIGHNGAGKSTLLKILSRITEPIRRLRRRHRPGRLAARGRDRLPPRADRAREHLPQRLDPRNAAGGDRHPLRRNRRVRRDLALPRHAGQALLERDVGATCLRRRRPSRAGDPPRRRGPRRRRRLLPAQVAGEDERGRQRGTHGRLRLPQPGDHPGPLHPRRPARARRSGHRRADRRSDRRLPADAGALRPPTDLLERTDRDGRAYDETLVRQLEILGPTGPGERDRRRPGRDDRRRGDRAAADDGVPADDRQQPRAADLHPRQRDVGPGRRARPRARPADRVRGRPPCR